MTSARARRTRPECIECATCQSRHGGSSDSPPPSPPFEVPDCPGLGPCFNESGDNTQVLFWLWVGFFALFALCCCACIVLSYRAGQAQGEEEGKPHWATEMGVWSLLCACLGLIIAIGLVIGWRVQMSETFDAPPGGSIVCGVGTKLNAAGNGCDLDEDYMSSEVSYSYDEIPQCPGIGPCFNESGDNTQVLFWLWVGSFSLCGFAFIIVMCSSATAADAETTPPCLSGCRIIMCLSLVLAIGLVIGWRVRMSEDSPIDDINRYAAAKPSCAAGTCTTPHCCEADGVHDDWCEENCCVGACDPVTCNDHAPGELSHCDAGRCFGCAPAPSPPPPPPPPPRRPPRSAAVPVL